MFVPLLLAQLLLHKVQPILKNMLIVLNSLKHYLVFIRLELIALQNKVIVHHTLYTMHQR